jgi:hypothetical protein
LCSNKAHQLLIDSRLSAIHLRHCTEKTEAKGTSIIVDAATKAGPTALPMCKLIEHVQQKAAAAMADTMFRKEHGAPTYIHGVPTPGTLAGSFLPGELPEELTADGAAALEVHRAEARKKARTKYQHQLKAPEQPEAYAAKNEELRGKYQQLKTEQPDSTLRCPISGGRRTSWTRPSSRRPTPRG